MEPHGWTDGLQLSGTQKGCGPSVLIHESTRTAQVVALQTDGQKTSYANIYAEIHRVKYPTTFLSLPHKSSNSSATSSKNWRGS